MTTQQQPRGRQRAESAGPLRSCFIEFPSLAHASYAIGYLSERSDLVDFHLAGMFGMEDEAEFTITPKGRTEVYFVLHCDHMTPSGEAAELAFHKTAELFDGEYSGS